ncbi:MAG: glycogen debranching protein GlgX [Acidobacteria bacterium]|nr:glycogen debranching protein GlgX [Acidobacteriota bacterium]
MPRKMLPGRPYPLGATWDGVGVNFAIYSEHATAVELCLFGGGDHGSEDEIIALPERTAYVWHGYIPGTGPGQLYAYRINGPFDPQQGLRFNPAKVLIDPYAIALSGNLNWEAPVFPYRLGHPGSDLTRDEADDCWGVPKCVVANRYFDWEHDRPPQIPLANSIIYEVHVKGFTAAHPDVPPELRGTYAGLVSRAPLEYLKKLGVTAVELMPVHSFIDDKFLADRHLRNYWGYNTINFFAPEGRYSSAGDGGGQVAEFKSMVKALHREGIEVILDVVYNHTAEGNHLGPMLSFRGIDNPTYYRLVQDQQRYYMDYTGTGNSLNVRHPQVLKLIMDSLRYWVEEMHVDGFRFDLASALARELHDVDRLSAFFDIIHQDPVISQVKLIAEPWDVGEGGYQVGKFPVLWAEWNGKYRDTVRRYWKGDDGQLAELGYRLTGSSDLYQHDGRRPTASINFITAHDGFTLHDLVTYSGKHNEDNGEGNRDGTNENYSDNYGVEGPTDDPAIIAVRERQERNFLATLLFSQGVPMICGGDEIERGQRGNNNAYCQDNELSWYNWDLNGRREKLLEFTRRLIRIRKDHPNLRRRKFFQDRSIRGTGVHGPGARMRDIKDITWLRPDGQEMTDEEWDAGWVRCLGVELSGETLEDVNENGDPIEDDTLLLLLNPHDEPIKFYLPDSHPGRRFAVIVDTMRPDLQDGSGVLRGGEPLELAPRSVALLRATEEAAEG